MKQRNGIREVEPGVWEVVISLGRDPLTGRYPRRTRRVHGKRRDAENARADMLLEARQVVTSRRDMKVGDLLDRWLAHLDTIGRRPSTTYGYRNIIERTLRPALGPVRIDRLTTLDLDRLYAALKARGQAPATIRQAHAIIRAALHQAQRWGLVRDNVAELASPPPIGQRDLTPPSAEDVVALMAVAYDLDPVFGLAVHLAAATGARRGEVCGVRWSDVDLDEGAVVIRRNISTVQGRPIIEGPTKTRSTRRVLLDEGTVAALKARRAEVAHHPDTAFVVSTVRHGVTPMRPDHVTKLWKRACETAKVDGVRFHDLRHAHATELLAQGTDIAVVARRLGHATSHTTHSVYAHALERGDRAAARIAGEVLKTKPKQRKTDDS